ncbi:Tetratricopeptide-like helical [Penicillium verrucosum]|uniref:Tetratricopeptide-like helical n=1 Tax=Penicillium verrucosum TaxID=60171 RepID=UPI0025453A37|nr:Tetratricopeptide-like helical [Penicillium verrucosum]KAJ5932227.1 Tetratricopeptide-like helical [Penicillium verrucosum]
MAWISDLIRDSKLETHFLPDCRVETVHRFQESDPISGQRLVTRSEHWCREKRVGGGGSGSVWLEKRTKGGRPGQDGAVRAVKQIDMDTRFGSIDYHRELEAIAKFSHPRYERCFVKSFGWYEGPNQLFISMEYLEIGDLFTYLYPKTPTSPLPEAEAREIAYQILDGLSMMHQNGFAHRDLKPNNILIKSHPPNEWWIKLADFGITKRIGESYGHSTTVKGTPRYFAPEIWGFVEPGSAYATDIWALGAIIFEVLTKKPTFATAGLLAKYKTQQDFPVTMLIDAGISQSGVDFVLSLICFVKRVDTIANNPTPKSTKSIEYKPRAPSIASTITEEFASWTTKISPEAPEGVFGIEPSSTAAVDLVNPIQEKTTMTQKKSIYSSVQTTVLDGTKDQDEAFEPRLIEPKSQHTTSDSVYRLESHQEAENMYRELLREREEVGQDIEDTLNSTYVLGLSLFSQGQYKEAETMLRRAIQWQEKSLGFDHKDAIDAPHWLGESVFRQKRYKEAETMFRRAIPGRARVLGHDHEDTLHSTFLLGLSLYFQGKYIAAQDLFQRSLQGRGTVLGHDHKDTLHCAQWLGDSILNRHRYKEAETEFRRALQGREKVLGHDHTDTLNSMCGLGHSLFGQGRYREAEVIYGRAVKGREKLLGLDHQDAINARTALKLAHDYTDHPRHEPSRSLVASLFGGMGKSAQRDV